MAYSGSTAATPNPPISLVHGIGGFQPASTFGSTKPFVGGTGLWFYTSTNLTTDMTSAGSTNFFADALALGMRNGDLVIGVQYTSAGSSFIVFAGAIQGLSTAGAYFSSGGLMTSTFG